MVLILLKRLTWTHYFRSVTFYFDKNTGCPSCSYLVSVIHHISVMVYVVSAHLRFFKVDLMVAVLFSGIRVCVVMFHYLILVVGVCVLFAVLLSLEFFVFINVYMPCESGDVNRSEFCDTLNIIESIVDDNDGCYVVLGGDFNVDFGRNWCNSSTLRSFCTRLNLYPVIFHEASQIDYSYHFSMKHFHTIDHFIVSEQLFQESVKRNA